MAVASSACENPRLQDAEEQQSSSSGNSSSSNSCDAAGPKVLASREKAAVKSNFTAPKVWMVVFGVVLAICAGAVDVVTARGLAVFVSHVTGTVARVGMRLEGLLTGMNEPWDWFHSILLVVSFIFGSFLCGLVIPKNQVHFGGKSFYGVALLGNGSLLIAAGLVAPQELDHTTQGRAVLAGCLAAMACGLQNAMCTMHFGAIVRTTHVTGTATDIGSTAGRAAMILLRSGCRHRRASEIERVELCDDARKLFVLLPIFAGFLCGAILGAFLHSALGMHALFVPAMVTGTTGLIYTFFRTQMKRQLKKLEERQLKDELDEMESALQRARSLLETASHGAGRLDEIGDVIDQSYRVVTDFEAAVAGWYSEAPGRASLDRARTF